MEQAMFDQEMKKCATERTHIDERAPGELRARDVADATNRNVLRTKREIETDRPADGLPAAIENVAINLDEQRALLTTLFQALDQSGLLRPMPPATAANGGTTAATPKTMRLSARVRELAGEVNHHNVGLAQILERLDI
jgi:hypothetical protein